LTWDPDAWTARRCVQTAFVEVVSVRIVDWRTTGRRRSRNHRPFNRYRRVTTKRGPGPNCPYLRKTRPRCQDRLGSVLTGQLAQPIVR